MSEVRKNSGRLIWIKVTLLFVLAALPNMSSAETLNPSDGRALFADVFNPEGYYPFDWRGVRADGSVGTEELILTVRASARDDYLPAYAMAIAYVCDPGQEKGSYTCEYEARMLRFKNHEDDKFESALSLAASVKNAKNKKARRRALDNGGMEWLETRLLTCEGAVDAMDMLATKADWKPSLHYTRIKMEDRELVLHPAQMWIKMHGNDQISSFQGWRNGSGAPYAVRNLITKLDECWKPATTATPWRQ